MVIVKIEPDDVIAGCRKTLGLPPETESPIDDTLLAALLRRSAGIHCPCSRATLRASLLESLQYLSPDEASLSERIDAIIEGLMVVGELLELNDVTTEDSAVRGTWVFAAPPSYIVRPGGSVFLTGIVADQDAFLPQPLASRIVYEGFTRVISPEPDEDLSGELREQGLQSLPESVWLKSPKAETAGDMLSAMERRLEAQPPSGAINDLQILDPAQLEPNPEANGGRVLVIEGDLASQTEVYEQVCAEAAELGNYPVDLLACVPPSLVLQKDHEPFSLPGRTLIANGKKVWDASSIDVRGHFPTDRDALRIVQYDSCRGLEGWTVINYGFDEFWEYKYRQRLSSPQEPGDLFETPQERATAFASRWAMIPLTRAMDTLVINVSAQPGPIGQALAKVQKQRADFVEWVKL